MQDAVTERDIVNLPVKSCFLWPLTVLVWAPLPVVLTLRSFSVPQNCNSVPVSTPAGRAQRQNTVTAQVHQSYTTGTAQSQHSHDTVTAQLQHSHTIVTPQAQHRHTIVTPQARYSQSHHTARPQHSHSTATAQSQLGPVITPGAKPRAVGPRMTGARPTVNISSPPARSHGSYDAGWHRGQALVGK